MKIKNQALIVIVLSIGISISACKKQTDYQPQIDALKSSVNLLKQRSDSLTTVINNINSSISTFDKKIDSIERKLDTISNQIKQLDTQLTSVNANIATINSQLQTLSQQYASLLEQLNALITQIAAIPTTLSSGLAGYYPFDGNANDMSGNGDNGVVNGASLTSDRFGKANSAYSFDGLSNFINIPNPFFGGTINSQFSISIWFKANALNNAALWGKNGFWQGLNITLNSDGSILLQGSKPNPDNYQNAVTGAGVISPNKWYNLIVIYNNVNCSMYVNGTPVNVTMSTLDQNGVMISNTMAGSVDWGETPGGNSNGTNQIGCLNSLNGGNQAFFSGTIDDFRLYGRVLTPQEIAYLATY